MLQNIETTQLTIDSLESDIEQVRQQIEFAEKTDADVFEAVEEA